MRFEAVIAVNNKITIFRNEVPFILVNMIQYDQPRGLVVRVSDY